MFFPCSEKNLDSLCAWFCIKTVMWLEMLLKLYCYTVYSDKYFWRNSLIRACLGHITYKHSLGVFSQADIAIHKRMSKINRDTPTTVLFRLRAHCNMKTDGNIINLRPKLKLIKFNGRIFPWTVWTYVKTIEMKTFLKAFENVTLRT
mgnify:FL=1